ncbi:MAG: tellurite resistance TerB family protein [Sphingomonadales bacterium]
MTTTTISPETAMVYLMVIVSASDRDMTDSELSKIGETARTLPAFEKYNEENLIRDAKNCAAILSEDEGLEAILGLVKEAIPETHLDTAYAVACDIAVADGRLEQEELQVLKVIRTYLGVNRLQAAAIEAAIVARTRAL